MKNLAAVALARRRKGIKETPSVRKKRAAIGNLRKAWDKRKADKPDLAP